MSPSSRRAWIEIRMKWIFHHMILVALLAEGVDRNQYEVGKAYEESEVALLAEGVDRNA